MSVRHGASWDCGLWRPGAGEPDDDWTFTPADLEVSYDPTDRTFGVSEVTPEGLRGLVSVPLEALFGALAEPEGGHAGIERVAGGEVTPDAG